MTLEEIISSPKQILHANMSDLVMAHLKKEAYDTCGNNITRMLTKILAQRYGLLDKQGD